MQMATNRSAQLKSPWQCRLQSVDIPESPPAGEVVIRVDACAICGTDLHAAEAGAKDWQAFGHEVAGTIEAVGEGASHLSEGQRVVLETSSFCGTCALCRNGQTDRCNKAPQFWGRPAMGFSDRMLVPSQCVVPYEGLTADVACMTEPAGVAYDMVKTAGISLGESVAIVGPGPIGLMAIPIALRSGATNLVCIGRSGNRRRLDIADRWGAQPVVADEALNQRSDLTKKFDHVLCTAPVQFLGDCLSLLAYGGRLTYIGIGVGSGEIRFDANDFHYRKLQLRSSFASPAMYFPIALQLMTSGVLPAAELISHRFGLDRISDAMELLQHRKSETVKVVIMPVR